MRGMIGTPNFAMDHQGEPLVDAGAGDTMLRIADEEKAGSPVRCHACHVIAELAFVKENCATLRNAGAITVMLWVATTEAEGSQGRRRACSALANLARVNPMPNPSLIGMMLRIAKTEARGSEIRACACHTLANLSRNASMKEMVRSDGGGFVAAMTAIVDEEGDGDAGEWQEHIRKAVRATLRCLKGAGEARKDSSEGQAAAAAGAGGAAVPAPFPTPRLLRSAGGGGGAGDLPAQCCYRGVKPVDCSSAHPGTCLSSIAWCGSNKLHRCCVTGSCTFHAPATCLLAFEWCGATELQCGICHGKCCGQGCSVSEAACAKCRGTMCGGPVKCDDKTKHCDSCSASAAACG
eukprot:gene22403-33376_t